MDNAYVVDGVLAAVMLISALIGAKRGLFKTLMGLVVVVAAMVGAVFLAGLLTGPITDAIAPRMEDQVVSSFSRELDKAQASGTQSAEAQRDNIREMMEEYHLPTELLDSAFSALSGLTGTVSGAVKEQAANTFRAAVSASIRTLVSGAVRAVVTLVSYIVLLVVLKLLVNLFDHVFDLPVLGTANRLGGAAVGLLEAVVVLYVLIYFGSHLGIKVINDHAHDTILLPLFLNHSPVELLSSIARKG